MNIIGAMAEGSKLLDLDDANDLSSPAEEQHFRVTKATHAARPNQKRTKNFSEKEDKLLVSAWLNVSIDEIEHDEEESRMGYWSRIFHYFHLNKDFHTQRSQNSLSHRWFTIRESIHKFTICLSQIEDSEQSGLPIPDQVRLHVLNLLLTLYGVCII
jgi:hypothetical protein